MDLPASLTKILNQVNHNTTSHVSINYKCDKCRDTGFVQTDNGFKRCECYEMEYTNRLWENFGINPGDVKLLKNYKSYNEQTKKAKDRAAEYIKSFLDNSLDKGTGFSLMGQSGAGKTHIILAIGKALLDQKIKVIYMPYLEAIRELKANAMDDEYYSKLSNRFKMTPVLIIDDLFKDKVKKSKLAGEITPADMNHIYPILNYRYSNKLPTLISTECTPNMLIDLDEALAGRILERCSKQYGITFKKDCNYRLREFI